jgi:hypothetical protein
MRSTMSLILAVGFLATMLPTSCASLKVPGNDRGSKPLSESEANDYRRAVGRCYKTGGTRVVKIAGELRCFD